MMADKKGRAKKFNWTEKELGSLLRLANQYASIIENKQQSGVCKEQKNAVWTEIADAFNATARTVCFLNLFSFVAFH